MGGDTVVESNQFYKDSVASSVQQSTDLYFGLDLQMRDLQAGVRKSIVFW